MSIENIENINLNKNLLSIIPNIQLVKYRDVETLRIEEDLGIYGDDAAELLFEYASKFNVDLSQFNFDLYFNKESVIVYFCKLFCLYKLFPKLSKKRKALTIADLQKGIEAKQLI